MFRCLLASVFLLALLRAPVHAATITVDGTTCALGDAIVAANTDAVVDGCPAGDPGLDTIVLDADVTLTDVDPRSSFLGSSAAGLPDITDDLVLRAGAADLIQRDPTLGCTLDDPLFRFFYQDSDVLTLEGLRFEHGCGTGNGGGILSSSQSTIHLVDVTVRQHRYRSTNRLTGDRGGFLNASGDATVTDSLFEDIELTGNGELTGGLIFGRKGLTIDGTVFRRVTVAYSGTIFGGAVFFEPPFGRSRSLVVRDSDFADVTVDVTGTSVRGGAVYARTNGAVAFERVTFARIDAHAQVDREALLCAGGALNVASANSVNLNGITVDDVRCGVDLSIQNGRVLGGAVYASVVNVFALRDCAIRGSRARLGARTDGFGGALYVIGGAQTVERCSFVDSAIVPLQPGQGRDARGGAVYLTGATSSTLRNVTVVGSRAEAGDNVTARGTGGDAFGGGVALEALSVLGAVTPTHVTLAHVTLAQNEARAGAGGSASGGGLAVAADVTATIDNAILAGNVRVDDAGL
ncbi:MAG: hypothetical protein AAF772_20765, partial [Acidobacteriota bacterium]